MTCFFTNLTVSETVHFPAQIFSDKVPPTRHQVQINSLGPPRGQFLGLVLASPLHVSKDGSCFVVTERSSWDHFNGFLLGDLRTSPLTDRPSRAALGLC